jgi:hypothetical protein
VEVAELTFARVEAFDSVRRVVAFVRVAFAFAFARLFEQQEARSMGL